jgi:hypothetical protein
MISPAYDYDERGPTAFNQAHRRGGGIAADLDIEIAGGE